MLFYAHWSYFMMTTGYLCKDLNDILLKGFLGGMKSNNAVYFINNICRGIDYYSNRYGHFVIMGDFNLEPTEELIENLCVSYNLYNLVKEPTCLRVLRSVMI